MLKWFWMCRWFGGLLKTNWQSHPHTSNTFSVSPCHLRRVQKIMRKARNGVLEVRRGKNERLLGLCQQQQVNTEATDVLWAPSTHVPHRFKITHVAGDFNWCDACVVSACGVLVTASLSFCYFSCHLNHKGGFHILAGWSSLPVNVIVHAGLRGYFPGVQIWESMSLIHSLPLLPFLAQSLPGSLLAPKFLRLRCGPCSMRRRARWNMPFWEFVIPVTLQMQQAPIKFPLIGRLQADPLQHTWGTH